MDLYSEKNTGKEMSDKDKFDEVFETLKQASYVFCNNVDGDVDDGKKYTCPYATVDEDGFVSCRERNQLMGGFACIGIKWIRVLEKYREKK